MDTASSSLARILALYRTATSSFLLRQLAPAYATSLEALALLAQTDTLYGLHHAPDPDTRQPFLVLKQKLWVLNTTIFGAILADRVRANHASQDDDHHNLHDLDHDSAHGPLSWRVRKQPPSSTKETSKESPELLVRDLWTRLVDDYGGVEGNVDGKVMVSIALLCIHQSLFQLARQISEAYLVSIPEDMLIHLEAAAGAQVDSDSRTKNPAMIHYERLTELYVVHILAKLGDWDAARDFVDLNAVLCPSSKKVYARTVEKLYRKSLRPKTTPRKKRPGVTTNSVDLENHASPTSSANSTLVSSPTISSLSLPFSHKSMHSTDMAPSKTTSHLSTKRSTETAADTTLQRQSATAARAAGSMSLTVQGKVRILMQWYTELVQRISSRIGPTQLMMVVAVIVLLAAVARNRVRAKTAMATVLHRMVQSMKGRAVAGHIAQ